MTTDRIELTAEEKGRTEHLTPEEEEKVERFMKHFEAIFEGGDQNLRDHPGAAALFVLMGYYISKRHGLQWFQDGVLTSWSLYRQEDGRWVLVGVTEEGSQAPGGLFGGSMSPEIAEHLWYMARSVWETARLLESY